MTSQRSPFRIACAAWLLLGCTLHPPAPPIAKVEAVPADAYRAGPAISGSWYDPARSGEGFVLQFLTDGRPLVFWFTYPPAGEPGEQAWLIAQDGVLNGATLRFEQVLRPVGARFGDAFGPSAVERQPWGSLRFEFTGCNAATVHYQGPAAWGSGSRNLVRLTTLDGLDCDSSRPTTSSGAPALSSLRARSGAWYAPERSGEGWAVEELAGAQTLVYWFTFTPDGQQAWTIGQGERTGTRVRIASNLITRGTRFGDGFDAATVQRADWGALNFDFSGCDQLRADYASVQPGYGSAERAAVRLTSLGSLACIDGTPQPPTQARWVERARMPAPWPSELAVTTAAGQLYALGGFGARQQFRRYEPGSDRWSVLPALPAGRDHLAAYALDDAVHMTGGAADGTGDPQIAGYRFDLTTQAWTAVAELPFTFGSHAAVLGGKAYIGDQDGSLLEHDARTGQVRRIQSSGVAGDHSQVVEFMGEIWMIGGRSPDHARVSIYDPVRERWRRGPSLNRVRGGFAAAVVGPHIVVTGGEVLDDGPRPRLETSSEVYSAGADRWITIADLPVPVHGTAAGTVGGQLYVVSGSTLAGLAGGATGRLFALELQP